MKEKFDANAGQSCKTPQHPNAEIAPQPAQSAPQTNGHTTYANGHSASTNGHTPGSRVDAWTIVDLLAQRWHWLVLGAAIFAGGFYLLGNRFIQPKFTASAQLYRYESPGGAKEFFSSAAMSSETLAGLIRSPEVLRRVNDQALERGLPAPGPEKLLKCIKVEPDADSDLIKIQFAAREPEQAVDLLNLYTSNSVAYLLEMRASQAGVVANNYLKAQLDQVDKDVSRAQNEFRGVPLSPAINSKFAEIGTNVNTLGQTLASSPRPSRIVEQQTESLNKAMGELNELLLKYTTNHPAVQVKQGYITELQKQLEANATNSTLAASVANSLGSGVPVGNGALTADRDLLQISLRSIEDSRQRLTERLREAKMYAENPPGNLAVLAPANLKTVQNNMRWLKIPLVTVLGGLLGLAMSLVLVGLVEFVDSRLKTTDDLARVARLPILTTLNNLNHMGEEARSVWAFRTWTMLQGRLSRSPNHGLVCGVTSSGPGEGRSTWINMLAEAASLTGFRVLTIATKPSPTHVLSTDQNPDESTSSLLEIRDTNGNSTALTTNVLMCPSKVTEQLTGPNSQPVVHIPLPGWVWNLERRRQWREALNHWGTIDNLVILVELPPACAAEAVLLGSHLPNLIWLAESGKAEAAQTRAQLETLRYARCNLVGAVLNHEAGPPVRTRFPRWVGCLVTLGALSAAIAHAQDTNAVAPAVVPDAATPMLASPAETTTPTNLSFSIVHPSQRAAWQQHLTLGPGDVLNFGLYGEAELARPEVTIAPDGRVSYLEASDVLAAGLTIDELRAKFDQELSKYRRAPHTIITPVTFKSKKYYMLGKVMTKGVYTLDRPMTVLEAIARAHGLENGLVDRNIVDLADFQRSFLMRSGKRYPLDFERLFQSGDLSQNIAIEPGDYLYFPGAAAKEVYVVGEIRLPGGVGYANELTIIGAITARGGYTDRAYKARVLVVRGSINHPELFAVDTHAILDAKANDFKLQPKDIIFVNSRPFIRVEELADLATTAFIQSLITSWVGVDVVKPFSQ